MNPKVEALIGEAQAQVAALIARLEPFDRHQLMMVISYLNGYCPDVLESALASVEQHIGGDDGTT